MSDHDDLSDNETVHMALSTTGRSVSAGSVSKRRRIASDDEASAADYTADYSTPSPGVLQKQRPRRKPSAQDTKRRLCLENLEKKRRKGSLKKKLLSEDSQDHEYIYVNDSSDEDELTFDSGTDNKSEEEDLEEGQSESSQSEEDTNDFIVSKDSENVSRLKHTIGTTLCK
ncbi:uncharacterized protein [Montipora foliosa]|uniref:uncharacterized protein isoform X2 n=1 Tax=Montipora foliosa TaxID=591990 RepID=UPI0035F18B0B